MKGRENEGPPHLRCGVSLRDREFEDGKLLNETAQAQLKVADIMLDYTRVRAPFAGRITRRMLNAGQNVAIGTHLFSIADLDPLLARVHMPD